MARMSGAASVVIGRIGANGSGSIPERCKAMGRVLVGGQVRRGLAGGYTCGVTIAAIQCLFG